MQGKLVEHPLAELIREITTAGLSGALRLSRERAKAAIYFEDGRLVFATSNLRVHRLREILKRSGISDKQLAELPLKASDQELADSLLHTGRVSKDALATIRSNQVSDVLRLTLLWTDGTWEFDSRVRLADEIRVQIEVNRLLLECARHLPSGFVKSRLNQTGGYKSATRNDSTTLLPAEVFVLSRTDSSTALAELAALSSLPEEDTFRAIYALSLSGLLQRSDWPVVFGAETSDAAQKAARTVTRVSVTPQLGGEPAVEETDDAADAQALFARLENLKDHYEVLDVARVASIDEIKNAYHELARRFHPDRFHQSAPELRRRVESAFARIAQAYETLSDQAQRKDYDSRRTSKATRAVQKSAETAKDPNGAKQPSPAPEADRAEASFRHGMDALQRNRPDEAIRFLAEAAMLAPREARYRAHYGHALISQTKTRRIAETELQTALSLEPENTSFRVMLAELYQRLGLRRRAEGELARALAADPKNEAARALLVKLKGR
jgi:curved DNA-binding protein CbpA